MKNIVILLLLLSLSWLANNQEATTDSSNQFLEAEVTKFIHAPAILAFTAQKDFLIEQLSTIQLPSEGHNVPSDQYYALSDAYTDISGNVNTFMNQFIQDIKTYCTKNKKSKISATELKSLSLTYRNYLIFADSIYNTVFKLGFDKCCTSEKSFHKFTLAKFADSFANHLTDFNAFCNSNNLTPQLISQFSTDVKNAIYGAAFYPSWEANVTDAPEGEKPPPHTATNGMGSARQIEGKINLVKMAKDKTSYFNIKDDTKIKPSLTSTTYKETGTDPDSANISQYGMSVYYSFGVAVQKYNKQNEGWDILQTEEKNNGGTLKLNNLLSEKTYYRKWDDKYVILFSNTKGGLSSKLEQIKNAKAKDQKIIDEIADICGDGTCIPEGIVKPTKKNDNTLSFKNFVTADAVIPIYLHFGK